MDRKFIVAVLLVVAAPMYAHRLKIRRRARGPINGTSGRRNLRIFDFYPDFGRTWAIGRI